MNTVTPEDVLATILKGLVNSGPFSVSKVQDRIDGAVYVGRSNSRFGRASAKFYNPYIIGGRDYDWLRRGQPATREDVINKYAVYLCERPFLLRQLPSIRGKVLECWCRSYGQREPACHADVLLTILYHFTDEQLMALA